MFAFELGQTVKDKITGYTGVVMARIEYFTGCLHYGIQPKKVTKDGRVPEWEYIDQSRLVLVEGKGPFVDRRERRSGPFQNPPQA
ncbi:MAG: hypothetical protein V2B18_00790 [Pseudomonadota bacterium]